MDTRRFSFLLTSFWLFSVLLFLFFSGCVEEECNQDQDQACSEQYGSCIEAEGSTIDSICGECFDGYLSCLESAGCLYGLTHADCDFSAE